MDAQSQALDIVEKEILTDLFGGCSSEHLAIRYGIFKISVADKVQKFINDFESKVKPMMDAQGNIQPSVLKGYLPFINLNDQPCQPVEIYRSIKPLISGLKGYVLGV